MLGFLELKRTLMECLDLSQPTMGCQDVKQEGNGPLEERATMTLNLTSDLNSVSTITVINIMPFIFIFMALRPRLPPNGLGTHI